MRRQTLSYAWKPDGFDPDRGIITRSTAQTMRFVLKFLKGPTLTLKKEAARPAGANILQQPAKFDAFFDEFNNQWPYVRLSLYRFAHTLPGHSGAALPFHDGTVMVTSCGRLCLYRKKIILTKSLAGQAVGVKEVDSGVWLVSFMDYDLG